MLREVTSLVHAQLREYDFLARYAGDEFVAIVPDVASEYVEDLRERIEQTVANFSIDVRAQGRARVGISVGSAVYGTDGDTLDQLVTAADRAMYRAKSTHKAQIFGGAKLATKSLVPAPDKGSEDLLASLSVN